MRLKNRIVLTLAGLFVCQFLLQGYFDYRHILGASSTGLWRQARATRESLDSSTDPMSVSKSAAKRTYGDTGSEIDHRGASEGNGAALALRQILLVDGGIALLAFLLTTWLVNRILLIPIGRLKQLASGLAGEETGLSAELAQDRELEQVSQHLEQMEETVKLREQALNRQKSLYAVLSHTNQTIIRDVEPRTLFDRFCEIAVSYGEFTAAWIGEVEPGSRRVRPVASSVLNGVDGGDRVFELVEDSPLGMAFLGRCAVIIDQIDWQHGDLSWCRPVMPLHGQSAAVLPILRQGRVCGLLAIYAEAVGYFDETVQDLLNEVAGDIAFAIDNHARRQAHRTAHEQLSLSSRRLAELNHQMSLLLESTGEGIFGVDQKGYCTFVNRAAASMLGYRQEQLLRQPIHRLVRMPELAQQSFSADMTRQRVPRRVKDESFRRQDDTLFPVEYSTHPMLEAGCVKGAVTVFRDVTETRSMLREMRFLASHDPLTHLLNRHAFDQRLRQAFADARDYALKHVLFYMDLDQFKLVNDTCGHVAGDTMLRHLSHHLRQAIGADGVLARLGGDEFGLLLERSTLEHGVQVAERIFEAVKGFRFAWEGRSFSCGVSIGMVEIDAAMENTHTALSAADTACYVAKDMGRNRLHIYRPYDEEIARQQVQMRWVNRIETAIQQERFSLLQQSILSIGSQAIGDEHVEVLLRMRDEQGREIPPGAFIPAAERYNLMASLDRWVIRNTFSWLADHPARLEELGLCAINLSGQSLGDSALYEYILEQLREFQLPAEKISFEVTETAVVSRLDQATRFISLLKRRGFHFSLDDFGTGMSSFAYLKSLPVDFLKIDGSFVRNMLHDPVDRAMVESINRIGHLMGLRTIAEYVESDQILEQLIDLGVDYAQGFGVMRPAPLETIGSRV